MKVFFLGFQEDIIYLFQDKFLFRILYLFTLVILLCFIIWDNYTWIITGMDQERYIYFLFLPFSLLFISHKNFLNFSFKFLSARLLLTAAHPKRWSKYSTYDYLFFPLFFVQRTFFIPCWYVFIPELKCLHSQHIINFFTTLTFVFPIHQLIFVTIN